MSIPFVKMHGLGNDFVLIDDLARPPGQEHPLDGPLAARICDRRRGVGADQLLWLKAPQSSQADARMEIFNIDGSIAEMCGNGIRAAALYLFDRGSERKTAYLIETLAGIKRVEISGGLVSVDMGQPVLKGGFSAQNEGEALSVAGRKLRFYEVDVGNPHAVVFVGPDDGGLAGDLGTLGPQIEVLPRFPNRTNVEIVDVLGPHTIDVRVWERGAGLTLACGTGACAAAVAALATRRVEPGPLEVRLPGGALEIRWEAGGPIIKKGPATEVFRGEFLA